MRPLTSVTAGDYTVPVTSSPASVPPSLSLAAPIYQSIPAGLPERFSTPPLHVFMLVYMDGPRAGWLSPFLHLCPSAGTCNVPSESRIMSQCYVDSHFGQDDIQCHRKSFLPEAIILFDSFLKLILSPTSLRIIPFFLYL